MEVIKPTGKTWEEYDDVGRIEAYRSVRHMGDLGERQRRPSAHVRVLHSPEEWGNPGGVRCAKVTTLWLGTDWDMFRAAANASRAVGAGRAPVTFVDVTAMSERRKDAHPSVHTIRQGRELTPEQQADPATYADCIQWCLPGVPDVWNLMLYARILSRPPTPTPPPPGS